MRQMEDTSPAAGLVDSLEPALARGDIEKADSILASTPPAVTALSWPGRDTQQVDFVRASETAPVVPTPRA